MNMPRKISTAIIQEQALVSLLTAAIEVYRKETYGLLVGSVKESRYKSFITIKNAVTYQHAVRKEDEVFISPKQDDRLRYVINYLSGCKILGEFHSHTCGIDYLSKHDVKDMIESGIKFSLLINVRPSEKKLDKKGKWHYDKKTKVLHGSINDAYKIMIKVYMREFGKKMVKKLKIDCPYIAKLNQEF